MDQLKDEEKGLPDGGSMLSVGSAKPIIDPKSARFPFCLVWSPLPVISWLAPYIGHVGICREDGVILDFAAAHFINVDNFAFGAPARYLQLDASKCCFPSSLARHTCKDGFSHAQFGTGVSWDNALHSSMQGFQHKSYNLFTCNCHSFVASCMNKLAYEGSVKWNVLKVVVIILSKGQWVDIAATIKSFAPFVVVMAIGLIMAGWSFFVGWAAFSFLLFAWFTARTYIFRGLIDC
ncbi:hypothetical protein O6H91_02G153600 [Diphasiastrum complanatum]|uniref:Uncharacterized protein n=1 Tax=Diphasiastrum complanatum TaxID=34168 RepID=A0ACC2EM81_DIPCM|nr:hypothetical protein O6H91_02G153600 [Diphasiastrum complanatum]